MDFQVVSVGIIVFAALIYIALVLRRKIKSFSSKSSCEIDCGCDGKKNKSVKI